MTRSEVLQRINELQADLIELKKAPTGGDQDIIMVRQLQIALITNHKQDLQAIYYAHLYKLP